MVEVGMPPTVPIPAPPVQRALDDRGHVAAIGEVEEADQQRAQTG
jgi:hypothetical protein